MSNADCPSQIGWFLEMKSRAMIRLHMNKENQTLARLYCHLCFSQMEEELPAGFEEVSCNVREDQKGLRSQVWASGATREEVRTLTPKLMPMRQTHSQSLHSLSYHEPRLQAGISETGSQVRSMNQSKHEINSYWLHCCRVLLSWPFTQSSLATNRARKEHRGPSPIIVREESNVFSL